MKLLLTGSTGFVGENLKKYLKPSSVITPVTRDELNGVKEKPLTGGASALVHLAGKAHDLKNVANSDEYYQVNYELTKQLYDAFLNSDISKFIFISSVKAVADSIDGILEEDEVPHPATDYGKSKLMAEGYIQSQPLPDGKAYYILRPCMIHGPGNKGNLNLLYKFVQKNIPYPLASFENRRSFLSVENLCFVINELLVQENVPSGVYHISDDEALSTNDVVSILAYNLKQKPKLWHIPISLISFMARVGDKLGLPLNTERLNKLTENYVVGNEKIKKTLNVQLPVTTREGLIITANSFG